MIAWLVGIGVAGFWVSVFLSVNMRPRGMRSTPGWWLGSLGIAIVGMGLALLLAWPMWFLGEFLGPFFDVSAATGGAVFACIFGLGGAALTGVLNVSRNERFGAKE